MLILVRQTYKPRDVSIFSFADHSFLLVIFHRFNDWTRIELTFRQCSQSDNHLFIEHFFKRKRTALFPIYRINAFVSRKYSKSIYNIYSMDINCISLYLCDLMDSVTYSYEEYAKCWIIGHKAIAFTVTTHSMGFLRENLKQNYTDISRIHI